MIQCFVFFLMIGLTRPLLASPEKTFFSMMLSIPEQEAISSSAKADDTKETLDDILDTAKDLYYLSCILCCNETDWTIWLNGQAFHHNDTEKSFPFKITHVTAHHISISMGGRSLKMKPHQTIDILSGKIYDGRLHTVEHNDVSTDVPSPKEVYEKEPHKSH